MARTRERAVALALTVLIGAVATLFSAPAFASPPAIAAPDGVLASPGGGAAGRPAAQAPAGLCSVEEWQADFHKCVDKLSEVNDPTQCLTAPTPSAPDSGFAGWFASRPESSMQLGPQGIYSDYGYAGYSYTSYDTGCLSGLTDPGQKFENTIANGEFMIATGVIGASNALRERAWEPAAMWGWADPLVKQATQAIYTRVFSVFGVITLAIVGLYLLWRSRQSDMSSAMTTAGWALLVMVAVTALATWPVRSANLADGALTSTLGVVHDAVGPRTKDRPPQDCVLGDPRACKDHRTPAIRASDTATETMLFRNWERGALGSADSLTAKKYGRALYDAKSFSWEETEKLRANPETRSATIAQKGRQWKKVAQQIKTEDPEAYEYLRGTQGMERIGAGFIAILAAVFFALFDITASILVLLGFLIFRWAVIAAPILGTVGLLRPASAGIRRLANAVVAAIFNIAIFGTGAAVYLLAVDLIMSTPTLPGWLQVVLVWLCGVVGWLLLRPYRRITQLGGKDSTAAITSAGSWHRRFFGDLRDSRTAVSEPGGTAEPSLTRRRREVVVATVRPEGRTDDLVVVETQRDDGPIEGRGEPRGPRSASPPPRRRRTPSEWVGSDIPEGQPFYAIYRPDSSEVTMPAQAETKTQTQQRVRAEAR